MYQIQAGQYLHTPGIQPLQVTEGKLHTKAPDLETLVSALATDSRLELVRSLLAALEGKAATETTLAAAKAALDAISGKIATEASLAQAVQKLTALLERLDQKLTVEGEVQLKGPLPAGAETIGGVTIQGSRDSEIEYLLNAVSVPPGGDTGYIPLDYKGCRKVILGVQSTQPWKIDTNTSWGAASDGQLALFSTTDLSQVQSPVISNNYPHQIVVGYRIGQLDIQKYKLAEALGLAILPPNLRVRVQNLSPDSVATVSVRIMRIW